ncbi:MAG: hypothetical protein M1281_05350 [Chloroflexi bacterium]|nr:hypothetical protein [Chloroflexota bacterium]
MNPPSSSLLTILTAPPGSLMFRMLLIFAAAGSLQFALAAKIHGSNHSSARLVFGLVVTLAIQALLLLVEALSWGNLFLSPILLPPLDRSGTLINLVWVVWMWLFPEPVRWGDALAVGLTLAGIVLLAVSLAIWNVVDPSIQFGSTFLAMIWELFSLIIVLLGSLALLIRRPRAWKSGIIMLGLLSLGYIVHMAISLPPGDFPTAVRFSEVAAFLLLFSLPVRFLARSSYAAPLSASGATALNAPKETIYLQTIRQLEAELAGLKAQTSSLHPSDDQPLESMPSAEASTPSASRNTRADLGEIIDEILQTIGDDLSQKEITLQLDLPDELPLAAADPKDLRQVVQFLLHTAIDAAPVQGTISMRLQTQHITEAKDAVCLSMTVPGGGTIEIVPPAINTLVQRMGGEINLEAVSLKSPSFRLTLPAIQAIHRS